MVSYHWLRAIIPFTFPKLLKGMGFFAFLSFTSFYCSCPPFLHRHLYHANPLDSRHWLVGVKLFIQTQVWDEDDKKRGSSDDPLGLAFFKWQQLWPDKVNF